MNEISKQSFQRPDLKETVINYEQAYYTNGIIVNQVHFK